MIKASGVIDGKSLEVIFTRDKKWHAEATRGPYRADWLLGRLMGLLETLEPVGGTYWPRRRGLLAGYDAIQNRFFDELESIETTYPESAFEQIPYMNGVVY